MEQDPVALVRPPVYTEKELHAADLNLQELVAAPDHKLIEKIGNTIHQNDGTHLHGGVAVYDDTIWQRRWKKFLVGPQSLYFLSRGKITNHFISLLTAKWIGARARK